MTERTHRHSLDALTLDFLIWVAATPRTHADVMDAWRSSCPRLTVWEDALIAGLVELDGSTPPPRVRLTAKGLERLNREGQC